MIELAETAIESSTTFLENIAESLLDDNFVEGKLDNPSGLWSGDNIYLSNNLSENNLGIPSGEIFKNSYENFAEVKNGWSSEINNSIRSKEEAQIYKDANLKEGSVNDRPCLQNPEIDWNQKSRIFTQRDEVAIKQGELPFGFGILDDLFSMTNKERALNGLAPLDSKGQAVELHHIGQKNDSPLAELTCEQHRQNGNHSILHDNSISSEVHSTSHESTWQAERSDYWKARAEML